VAHKNYEQRQSSLMTNINNAKEIVGHVFINTHIM